MRYSGSKVYYYLGAIILLLIFLNFIGVLNPVKNLFSSMLAPSLGGAHQLGVKIGDNYRLFKDKDEFLSAYAVCERDLQDKSVQTARIKVLEDENNELRKQLSFRKEKQLPTATANVIGRNTDSADKTIVIDQGEEAQLRVDDPVIVGDGVLIGKIAKVEKNLAVARLINDNQVKVAATVLNNERSLGVVEGGYGLSVRMSFIPRNEVVKVGDQVITSGLETGMPRGLLIGTVAAVENEPYQPFQQAVLTPAVDLSKLILVGVLLTK